YRQWIADQRTKAPPSPKKRKDTAKELLDRADVAARRIEEGIKLIADGVVLDAFRTTNRVIAVAQRRRRLMEGVPANGIKAPAWRPFQLAFLLMNLRGIVEPTHTDRDVVDLLFFPTGGGKTEAYLGLAAFTLVLRRLRNPGLASAGLAVLMRYTLRLLTLDQLSYCGGPGKGKRGQASGSSTQRRSRPRSPSPPSRATAPSTSWPVSTRS